ncbi:hypothetical protein [uncultured Fibrobacter sp.]|uniref:hypothetical protein n=1 Tax=uncultured Fibrobacter sp. TaxID=261512 RepID=UPI0025E35F6B|nr:hypothetical protein [uncultured Fibrobacter sp.]
MIPEKNMLVMKQGLLKFVWFFFAVWSAVIISIIAYTSVVYFASPYASKFIEAYVFFILFMMLLYFLSSKYMLLRIAKSVEKIDEGKYRVHTLLSHYDFCKKDVIPCRYGQIKIDIYSGKIKLKPDEYIDTTPKGNFLEEMLSR